MSQPRLFKFLLVGLPVGLAVSIVIAVWLYATRSDRAMQSVNEAGRFAAPVSQVDLQKAVAVLSETIGARSIGVEPEATLRARKFLQSSLGMNNMGYEVALHSRRIGGVDCPSVIAELPARGLAREVIVVAAPYTSAPGSPGAGRSGSGAAALLSIAKALAGSENQRKIRFVAYASDVIDPADREFSGTFPLGEKENAIAIIDLDTIAFPNRQSGMWEAEVPFIVKSTSEALSNAVATRFARGTGLRLTFETTAAREKRLPRIAFLADARDSPAGTANDLQTAYDYARFAQAVTNLQKLIKRLANPAGV